MPHIKKATHEDINLLYDLSVKMGHAHEPQYIERTLDLDDRDLYIIDKDGVAAGYVVLNFAPRYGYFAAHGIPEIQDLSVIPAFRQKGLAQAMIMHCEALARDKGHDVMGIGVGLHARFGAAQRLYAKLGYMPDGFGVTYDRSTVSAGSFKPIDDQLCIMMVKTL